MPRSARAAELAGAGVELEELAGVELEVIRSGRARGGVGMAKARAMRRGPFPFDVGPVDVAGDVVELGIGRDLIRLMVEMHRRGAAWGPRSPLLTAQGSAVWVHPMNLGEAGRRGNLRQLRSLGVVVSHFSAFSQAAPSFRAVRVETDMRGPRTRVVLGRVRKENPRRFGPRRFNVAELAISEGVMRKLAGSRLAVSKIGGKYYRLPAILFYLIDRHTRGDWGDVDGDDKRTNDNALKRGGRVLSAFELHHRTGRLPIFIWITTNPVLGGTFRTTVLLPQEY